MPAQSSDLNRRLCFERSSKREGASFGRIAPWESRGNSPRSLRGNYRCLNSPPIPLRAFCRRAFPEKFRALRAATLATGRALLPVDEHLPGPGPAHWQPNSRLASWVSTMRLECAKIPENAGAARIVLTGLGAPWKVREALTATCPAFWMNRNDPSCTVAKNCLN